MKNIELIIMINNLKALYPLMSQEEINEDIVKILDGILERLSAKHQIVIGEIGKEMKSVHIK